jgi:acylaminoacyl-peptidase
MYFNFNTLIFDAYLISYYLYESKSRCYSEAGVNFGSNDTVLPTLQTLENVTKFMEASPIKHVAKVQAPTLLLLGSEDLRVPMSQGTAYYRALKVANKNAE